MDESIYNLVPREYVAPPKESMYRSKHDPYTPLTGSTFGCKGTTRLPGAAKITRKDGALFGPATIILPHASLKKDMAHSKDPEDDYRLRYSQREKAPVPPKSDVPVVGMKSNKNFITANAVEAILQVPKPVVSEELNYLRKEDYGKVPEYLVKVKEEIRRENEMIDKYVKEQLGEVEREPDRYEEVPEQDRVELIAALKQKWDHVNASYQKITHLVRLDTTGQVRRKEQLEAELKQLETDIEKLSRASNVLIKA